MAIYTLKQIIEDIEASISFVNKHILNVPDRPAYADAISAIQLASIKTRNFIKKEGYVANGELSELWVDAMEKTIKAKIGDKLELYLIQKARFWGDPELWLTNPGSLSMVPKLNDLDEKCEMLLIALAR